MPRFFFSPKSKDGDLVTLSGQDVSHIKSVLRLIPGDEIELCDGEGYDYLANIETIEDDVINAKLKLKRPSFTETGIDVTLYQSISKGEKMDEVIQKCVELGVKQIVPVISKRTIVKFSNSLEAQKKTERWAKIAKEAAKQSGRGILPRVSHPLTIGEALLKKGNSLGIVASELERTVTLGDIFLERNDSNRSISVLCGPEGGWDKGELQEAQKHLWIPFTLGPRVLRTETAGMTVLSIVMFLAGEMKWKDQAIQEWRSIL